MLIFGSPKTWKLYKYLQMYGNGNVRRKTDIAYIRRIIKPVVKKIGVIFDYGKPLITNVFALRTSDPLFFKVGSHEFHRAYGTAK